MRKSVLSLAAAAALFALPGMAFADEAGAAAGAARGAATGAAVGGPAGAAVGAAVGGTAGGVATGPDRDRATVEQRRVETTGSVGCESGVPAPFRACPDTAATLAARRAPGPAEVTGTVPHDPADDALLRQLADRARAELLRAGPGAP